MRFGAAVLRGYEDPFAVEEVILNAGRPTARSWSGSRAADCAGPTSPSGTRRAAHRCPRCSATRGPGWWWRRAARTPASAPATMSC